MTLNGTMGERVWKCISSLTQLHGSKATVPLKLRGIITGVCLASKKEIESLEADEEVHMTNLKFQYWKTNEGRRDWFWWRMGKEDHEDLDDFVLGSETASVFRKYKNSRQEWLEKVEILHTLLKLDNITKAPVLVMLQDVNRVMHVTLENFRQWDKALQHRIKLINWDPPRHPFNTPDIEKMMTELEDSIKVSVASAAAEAYQVDIFSISWDVSDTSSSGSSSSSSGSLSPEFSSSSYDSRTSESDYSDCSSPDEYYYY